MPRLEKVNDELALSMGKLLKSDEAESKIHADKILYALSSLEKAASIFDDIGDHNEAEAITKIIEKIAGE